MLIHRGNFSLYPEGKLKTFKVSAIEKYLDEICPVTARYQSNGKLGNVKLKFKTNGPRRINLASFGLVLLSIAKQIQISHYLNLIKK
jgi:hypothetical protein